MPSDRPGDVARRLTELEATVRGLTQELVEANDRLRQLESRLESDDEQQIGHEHAAREQEQDAAPPETDDIIIA